MAEVISITRPYESSYVCDKCGADRACQCKSKGVSRKTWENEASKAKKAVRNQGDSPEQEKVVENIKESSQKAHEWRLIQSAPKNGEIVLLGGGTWGDDLLEEAPRVMAARWYDDGRGNQYWNVCAAEAGYSCFPYENPTHWMSLPKPPVGKTSVED